jgi:hypothetical protein
VVQAGGQVRPQEKEARRTKSQQGRRYHGTSRRWHCEHRATEFDMQFNNDARVYTGTITKVKQLRNKTMYVCEYEDGDSVQHTEEELRVALRGE